MIIKKAMDNVVELVDEILAFKNNLNSIILYIVGPVGDNFDF